MMTSPARPTIGQRIRAYLFAPGVIRWGLPVAITSTLWLHWREFGFSWASLWGAQFWIRLAVNVVITGIIGGNVFGYLMARGGLPLSRSRRQHRDPPT